MNKVLAILVASLFAFPALLDGKPAASAAAKASANEATSVASSAAVSSSASQSAMALIGPNCAPLASTKMFQAEGPLTFFSKLFDTKDFPPRWQCGNWSTDLGYLHIVSDAAIFGAYFAIPIVLLFFLLRKRDLPFPRVIWLFAAFILSCGLGHLLEAFVFWWPAYRLTGLVKAFTAIISWITVFMLIRIVPELLRLPSLAKLGHDLQASTNRLNCALKAGAIGTWEWIPKTDQLTCDARMFELFDIAPNTQQNGLRTFIDRVHPDDRVWLDQLIHKCVDAGLPFDAHYRVLLHDGSNRYIHALGQVSFDKDGHSESLVGVCLDITAQMRQKRKLRKSAATMRSVLNTAADGIITIDERGTIKSANPAAVKLFGYSTTELIGHNVKMLMPAPHQEQHDGYLRHYMKTRVPQIIGRTRELSGLRKDGSTFPMELSVSVVELGNRLLFTGIVRDVTERNRVEEALKLAKESAEHANNAKSDFLASMSHELRTPLNGVLGMTELLSGTQLDERQMRFVAACKSSGKSLSALINDILDFSKIEAGRLELDQQPFDLLQLLNDVMETMPLRIGNKPIELLYSFAHPTSLTLLGDNNRLRQVLVNLLGNATKFTERGEISLRVEPRHISTSEATILFSIQDTGIGIPADRLHRLFQEFSQVDSSISRKYGGSGLGLSISKSIVEAMGGTIGVESTEGVGSRFWFSITFRRSTTPLVTNYKAPIELQKLRVLVVDDNEACRNLLVEFVQTWGMKVHSASRASEALDALHEAAAKLAPFNLVLLTNNLPDVNGPELALRIHEDPQLQGVALFLMAAVATSAPQDPSLFDHCFYKPIGQSHLLDAIVDRFLTDESFRDHSAATNLLPAPQPASDGDDAPQQLTVLLAEDNETNQLFAREILSRAGWKCDVAVNGIEALEAVHRKQYDLILMDCHMPEMDGFTATHEIRKREAEGTLQGKRSIIALTANAVTGDREKCLEAGMDDYVAKPYTPVQLVAAVKRFLNQRAPSLDSKQDAPPKTAPAHLKPPINAQQLFESCMGDLAFAETLLQTFEKDGRRCLDTIVEHASHSDAHAAGEAAHALKGIAGIMAAESIQSLAANVEAAGEAGDIEEVRELITLLIAEVNGCLEYIPVIKDIARQKFQPEG